MSGARIQGGMSEIFEMYQPHTLAQSELKNDGPYLVYGANGVIGKHTSYNHEESQVLVTCRGATCGAINVSAPFSWINGNAMVIKPRENNVDIAFLKYYLKSGIDIKQVITGAAQPQITRQSLSFLKVDLPPLAEQQRIASILDKAELVKRKRELAIEKLDRLAESVFYEMFGDPLNNEKNWQQKSLGDVLTLITYGLTVRPNYVDVGIPLISAREIRNGSVNIQNGPKISRSDYDNLSDKSKPSFGDILFSKTGSIGHCALVETKIPFAVTQNAARLSFEKSTVNTVYALNYLRFGSIQALAQRSARGNAVKDLQLGVMKQFPFPLPPLSLQDQFAKRIAKLDQIKADSIAAFIKQKQLFLTLEHQAFSGQL